LWFGCMILVKLPEAAPGPMHRHHRARGTLASHNIQVTLDTTNLPIAPSAFSPSLDEFKLDASYYALQHAIDLSSCPPMPPPIHHPRPAPPSCPPPIPHGDRPRASSSCRRTRLRAPSHFHLPTMTGQTGLAPRAGATSRDVAQPRLQSTRSADHSTAASRAPWAR
jgi:hypothetical protein